MTGHPEQPKPSLVERLTHAGKYPIHPDIARQGLRELAAYLREMPENLLNDIKRQLPGNVSGKHVAPRIARAIADHLEKEAGNG